MATYLLGDFLLEQIQRRDMSAREFARFIGVNHQTINKFLDYGKKDVGYPSVDFIIRLAKATKTDAGTLMNLIEPTLSTFDAKTRLIAEQLAELSEHERKMVDAFIYSITRTPD